MEEKLILQIPIAESETADLQSELGKLIDGITEQQCTSFQCKNKPTIHQVGCFFFQWISIFNIKLEQIGNEYFFRFRANSYHNQRIFSSSN